MKIGCVYPRPEDIAMDVKGRCLMTGLPKVFVVSSSEVLEAFEAKGNDAEHLLQVGELASENAKLKALLEVLKSGTYFHDCHAYQTGPEAGEPFIMLINIHVNGEEAIKAAQEWLGA